jgi:DNA-binding NtrC family response regulator
MLTGLDASDFGLPELKRPQKSFCEYGDAGVKAKDAVRLRTILVVEDSEILKLCMVDLLERAKFTVVQARNAEEALVALEQRTDIALMITNVVMLGRMDGVELAHAVNARWPFIQNIVVSGKKGLSETDLPKKSLFLAKPYQENELMFEIRALLGS